MPKSKDRTLNPAAAQLKLDKQKALKKGKATVQAQRISRLATRNPRNLERQIADLQALPSPNARDKKNLEDAERELARVRRAKEIVRDGDGRKKDDHAPRDRSLRNEPGQGQNGGGGGKVLGKRTVRERERENRQDGAAGLAGRRGGEGAGARAVEVEEEHDDSGEETDASVRNIPMPRDTPPPIPRPRARAHIHNHNQPHPLPSRPNNHNPNLSNANLEPLSSVRGLDTRQAGSTGFGEHASAVAAAAVAVAPSKTVYEAKPMVRDLRKEAVNKFMPEAVRRRRMEMGDSAVAGADAADEGRHPQKEIEAEMESETNSSFTPIPPPPPPHSSTQLLSPAAHPHLPSSSSSSFPPAPPQFPHSTEQEQQQQQQNSIPQITPEQPPLQQEQHHPTKKLPLSLLYGDSSEEPSENEE